MPMKASLAWSRSRAAVTSRSTRIVPPRPASPNASTGYAASSSQRPGSSARRAWTGPASRRLWMSADRADDGVELGGPRSLGTDQLREAGLVGKSLAKGGGEPGALAVTLVLGLLALRDVVEGVDREL